MSANMDVSPNETIPQNATIESEKPEERIAARRMRIAARSEARKRPDLGEELLQEKTEEEPLSSQVQLDQSERHMNELCENGTKLVTNILVAVDARESKRRTELREAERIRNEKLENEAKSSLEQFEELTKKWTEAKLNEIPQDLRDALNQQEQLCDLMIEDKNKLIYELQQELKASDDRYVKDLKKHAEDVNLMIERMQEQIKSLKKAYREELDLIEKSFDDERKALVTENRKKWEQQRQERSDKEMELLLQRMKRVEEYEVLLQRLRMEDLEEYNMIKMKLEPDVEILEQQLQMVKATNQLNQEKLEYNYQVLKKRIEENTITKAEQKRKITKLQDALHNLKVKCTNKERQTREENQLLVDSYERAMQQYKDMQKRMRQFAAIDAKRFEEVWLMNEDEAKDLARKALEIDRIIHEQQLGLNWIPPSLPFMERSGPFQTQGSVQPTAMEIAAQGLGLKEDEEELNKMEGSEGAERSEARVDKKTVKRLLDLLCNETGFLIESKLLKILSPLEKDERSLMKLNSIFNALGIKNEEDIYKMAEFFTQYKQQLKVQGEEDTLFEDQDSSLIHPNDVVRALRAFTEQHRRASKSSRQQSSILFLEDRDYSADAAYWQNIANVLPESKLKMWSALEGALDKYHTVLKDRSKLVDEGQRLKQQNSELRSLLQQYHYNGQL